jgi:hypothetical protein
LLNQKRASIALYRKRLFLADLATGFSGSTKIEFSKSHEQEWALVVFGSGQIILDKLNFSNIRRLYFEMEASCDGGGTVQLRGGLGLPDAFFSEPQTLFRGKNQIKFYLDLPKFSNPLKIAIEMHRDSSLEISKIEVRGDL